MKYLFIFPIFLLTTFFLKAQNDTKCQEIGLTFMTLDNFGISYKKGNEQSVWRFNALLIKGENSKSSNESSESKRINVGFEFKLGKEFRKTISEVFELRFGADISLQFKEWNESERINPGIIEYKARQRRIYTPGFNLVVGFNYVVTKQLIIGAELLPFFTYSFGHEIESYSKYKYSKVSISELEYGISSNSALISVSYRF